MSRPHSAQAEHRYWYSAQAGHAVQSTGSQTTTQAAQFSVQPTPNLGSHTITSGEMGTGEMMMMTIREARRAPEFANLDQAGPGVDKQRTRRDLVVRMLNERTRRVPSSAEGCWVSFSQSLQTLLKRK